MADTSPRATPSKTAGTSITEKRAEKKAAAASKGGGSFVPPTH